MLSFTLASMLQTCEFPAQDRLVTIAKSYSVYRKMAEKNTYLMHLVFY